MENGGNDNAIRTVCPVEVYTAPRPEPPMSYHCSRFVGRNDTFLGGAGEFCDSPERNSDNSLCEKHYIRMNTSLGILCTFDENKGCLAEEDANGLALERECPEKVFAGNFSLPPVSEVCETDFALKHDVVTSEEGGSYCGSPFRNLLAAYCEQFFFRYAGVVQATMCVYRNDSCVGNGIFESGTAIRTSCPLEVFASPRVDPPI
eukprot:1757690-Pleurochrysis_carterae.AAC.1